MVKNISVTQSLSVSWLLVFYRDSKLFPEQIRKLGNIFSKSDIYTRFRVQSIDGFSEYHFEISWRSCPVAKKWGKFGIVVEDLFSKNWIKVDGSGRIRCGCGMVESDNLIFIKKLLQNCQVHVQATPEKQTLHWFRRSSK